jgi:hypothetical protein
VPAAQLADAPFPMSCAHIVEAVSMSLLAIFVVASFRDTHCRLLSPASGLGSEFETIDAVCDARCTLRHGDNRKESPCAFIPHLPA